MAVIFLRQTMIVESIPIFFTRQGFIIRSDLIRKRSLPCLRTHLRGKNYLIMEDWAGKYSRNVERIYTPGISLIFITGWRAFDGLFEQNM